MWEQFANMAAQYYVASRFSASAGHVPVCGSLMHHAVELQLKCGLIKAGAVPLAHKPPSTLDSALKQHYGHSLLRLWPDFKSAYVSTDLARFDGLIVRLDEWEEIRYPQRGIAMLVQAAGPLPDATAMDLSGSRLFTLHVGEMDRLFERLWTMIGINPEYFRSSIRSVQVPLVASVYETDNVHMIYS